MKLLGQILIDVGALDEGALENALDQQQQRGGRLGTVLCELELIEEAQLLAALAHQHRIDPVVARDLRGIPPVILESVPRSTALEFSAIPFRLLGDELRVAVKKHLSFEELDKLEEATELEVLPFVATEARHHVAMAELYAAPADARFFDLCASIDAKNGVRTAPEITDSESVTDSLELEELRLATALKTLEATTDRDDAADRVVDFLHGHSKKVALLKPTRGDFEHWMSEGLQVLTPADLRLPRTEVPAQGLVKWVTKDKLPDPSWEQSWNPADEVRIALEAVTIAGRTVAVVAYEQSDRLSRERVDSLIAAFGAALKRLILERR